MKSSLLFALLFGLSSFAALAQSFTVSGYVRDALTGESLIGCSVFFPSLNKGTVTNSYGFYSLPASMGRKVITYSFVGYEKVTIDFELTKDTMMLVNLKPITNELSEVVVQGGTKFRDLRLGAMDIPVSKIKNTPALLGETDLMKSLQFIAGVQNTSEGKSDLSVRGGSPDQNLILLDGVPIYNPNHIFGFLSVFNTDALKKVTLYKSDFPARFGGRLSSIVDITTKDGNKERLSGSASVGLPAVKFNLEGPIIMDKTSFTFSFRRTYLDLLMNAINKSNDSESTANFFFHDFNTKIHHKIDDKTFVYLSVYNGNDKLEQTSAEIRNLETNHNKSTEKWDWGNTIISSKLSRILTPNLFFRTTLTYNQYFYKMNAENEYTIGEEWSAEEVATQNFSFSSGIKDYSVSGDFEYFPVTDHTVKLGTALTFHDFNPEVISVSVKADTIKRSNNTPRHIYSKELAFYAEDDWDVSRKIRVNMGLRFSLFNVDKKSYKALDPRLSARFLLTDKISLQAGYTMMQQYVHLLSSNSIILQTDLWVPATGIIKPMQSNQYSLGMFCELPNAFSLSVESYYKKMHNLIEYKDGVNYTGVSSGWENKVEAGNGRSYGIEFSLEKKAGDITGTASYTWSKSERRFEEINFGKWFPSKYDHRHVINLSLNYQINEKFDFTAVWTYHSGTRISLPLMTNVHVDLPETDRHIDLMELDHRNNYKMDDYHRLDLGINYTFHKKKNSYCQLNIGVYNAYNRMNPYKIIVETDLHKNAKGENVYTRSLKQITLFPIIPSLSFSYHF